MGCAGYVVHMENPPSISCFVSCAKLQEKTGRTAKTIQAKSEAQSEATSYPARHTGAEWNKSS